MMALLSERYKNDGISVLDLDEIQNKYISEYTEKIKDGRYKYVPAPCECGSNDLEVIAEKDRYGIPLTTVICRNCGLIMTDPRLDAASNASFYDNEYHFIYRDEDKPSYDNFIRRKENAKDIIDYVRDHARFTEGRVLEIGCADGGNVAAFIDAGYSACGIDLSHAYTQFGCSQGLDLSCQSAKEHAATGKKYDLIVMNQVLEHFTDLESELGSINDLLAPDGILFISVPGVKYLSFSAYSADFLKMLQNAHVFNFTKDTLCQVMKKYGFDCIAANEFIYGLFKKGDPVSSFNNLYSDVRRYLEFVENAKGDNLALVSERTNRILRPYKAGDVLLYGSLVEMDILAGQLEDVNKLRGFLATDSKSADDVMNFIKKEAKKKPIRCLLLADSAENKRLMEYFKHNPFRGLDVYSIYTENF